MTADVNVVIDHSEYTILVVDDVVSNVLLLKVLLTNEKFKVVTANNGKDALVQAAEKQPDLILLDVMMPEMNGYETTKAIRNLSERPDGKEIPIIAMTANAFAEDVQAALHAGMDDHVAKPVDMRILISVITKYIER